MATRAGTRVTDTTSPTVMARLIAGPRLRKKSERAASRAPVPAATVMPATVTIGV